MDEVNSDRLNPVRLHYTTYIPESFKEGASPIIFIHGLAATSATWGRVMRVVAERTGRQVYALDMRNHGESEWTDVMTTDALRMDLENFMSLHNISKVVLIGHSFGCKHAMALCFSKPHLVEKIIIEECTISELSSGFKSMFENILKVVQKVVSYLPRSMSETEAYSHVNQVLHDFHQKNRENAGFPQSFEAPKFEVLPFYKNKETGQFDWSLNIEAIMQHGTKAECDLNLTEAQPFEKPSLFIYGKRSFVKPNVDDSKRTKYFPNSEFHILENGSHTIHLECPDKYFELVVKFLQSD